MTWCFEEKCNDTNGNHIGAIHTGSAQGSAQKLSRAEPSVWTRFSSDFQCKSGISGLSCRMFTLVESKPSSKPSQCEIPHYIKSKHNELVWQRGMVITSWQTCQDLLLGCFDHLQFWREQQEAITEDVLSWSCWLSRRCSMRKITNL